ncbi:unnamed protein product, partial [Didymodactylos carnosus]
MTNLKGFGCNENEHYCIKFVDDGNNINMTCLPLNKAADGITDCIRSTDERKINNCSIWYPQELDKRFHCMNSDICTDPSQVCDRTFDCPYGDDERVCPCYSIRLIIYLLTENDSIISHEEIVHNQDAFGHSKYFVYLMSGRPRQLPKYIRIDSYVIAITNVQYIKLALSNIIPLPFVNRLALLLLLEIGMLQTQTQVSDLGLGIGYP